VEDEKSVSDVFRARLRETRIDRSMSQDALAQAMQRAGYSMDKAAVLRIEKGQRGISLDEAFAFASVLSAVPAQLFTPPGEELVWLTKTTAVNGSGMRAWLRYGDSFIADSGDLPEELVQDRVMQAMAIHARAYLDAIRNEDKEGQREALFAMSRTLEAKRERREAAERKGAEA
jgi:transcriptional regulator with XRE-family HTH domain